jgi:hypothetical protein
VRTATLPPIFGKSIPIAAKSPIPRFRVTFSKGISDFLFGIAENPKFTSRIRPGRCEGKNRELGVHSLTPGLIQPGPKKLRVIGSDHYPERGLKGEIQQFGEVLLHLALGGPPWEA